MTDLRLTLPLSIAGLIATLHLMWAGMLFAGESATFVTVHNDTSEWVGGSRLSLAAILLVASALSVYGMVVDRRLWLFVPQQAVLAMESLAALDAIYESAFGDGVVRPRLFIAADQSLIVLLTVWHAAELVWRWPVRAQLGERPRRGR